MCQEDHCEEIPVQMDSNNNGNSVFSSSGIRTEVEVANSQHNSNKQFLCTPEKSCNSTVYNPFHIEIESLSLPSFSPSVFQAAIKSDEDDKKPFSWSIDQMAILAPVDIDETSHQDTFQELDHELEQRAQKAIEHFFSQNIVVPSPWGMPTKTVNFSPNIISASCFTRSNIKVSSAEKKQGTEVWTQTVLSIPPDIDILDRFGEFCTFHDDQYLQRNVTRDESFEAKDSLNASLRRQLFAVDRNSCTPSSFQNAVTPDTKMSLSPLLPWKTPEKQMATFFTPGSAQFSSSPISANCSISSNIHLHSLSSPPISPISKSVGETPSTGQNKKHKTPTCTSSPITRSIPDICVYTESTKLLKTPRSHQRSSGNLKASVRLSLLMLSTSEDEDCTEEMHSEVSLDSCGVFQKPSFIGHDTGYQTKSYQSSANHEMLPSICINSTENSSLKFGQMCENKAISQIRGSSISDGTMESEVETSSMDVDLFHQGNTLHNRNISALCSGWKPSVCSTPHL